MGFLSWATGADDEQKLSDELDAKRVQRNRERAERMAREQSAAAAAEYLRQTQINDERAANAGLGIGHTVEEDIGAAFDEGWEDGERNITNAVAAPFRVIGDGVNSVLGGVLKGVPWWWWIVGAVAVFLYFGGWAFVVPMLKRFKK